jgi:hypothetical protein
VLLQALTFATFLSLGVEPVRLASTELTGVKVDAQTAHFLTEHLAQALSTHGLQVATAKQIGALLGVERQRQLLGCSSNGSASCIAELADALGADGILLGEVAKLGARYQFNVKVLRSSSGNVVASWGGAVETEEALLDAVNEAASALASQLFVHLRPGASPPSVAGRRWPLVPSLIAGALALGGGVTLGLTFSAHARLVDPSTATALSPSDADRLVTQGTTLQWLSRGLFAGAGAALVTSFVLFLLSDADAPVTAGLSLDASGAFITFGGRL